MKLKFVIFVLFILPAFMNSQKTSKMYESSVTILNELASNASTSTLPGTPLKLKEDGFLRDFGRDIDNFRGFFYEGTIPGEKQGDEPRSVAIRFTQVCYKDEAEKEVKMYYYLDAYKKPDAEKYGIPVVYFFGPFCGFILTAFTMFDMDLQEAKQIVSPENFTDLDVLILLREFVFQSKYIHSLGVRHDHIRPENIMIRGHQSFLFGFNGSSKMKNRQRHWSKEYGYRIDLSQKKRAIDDYKSFLYIISAVTGKNWFSPGCNEKKIKEELVDTGSERIIKAFAEEVWPSNGKKKDFPNYNDLAEIIDLEMTHTEKIPLGVTAEFSWKGSDAETSAGGCRLRKIGDIKDPERTNSDGIKYPEIPKELIIDQSFTELVLQKGLEGYIAEKTKKLCRKGISCLKNTMHGYKN